MILLVHERRGCDKTPHKSFGLLDSADLVGQEWECLSACTCSRRRLTILGKSRIFFHY